MAERNKEEKKKVNSRSSDYLKRIAHNKRKPITTNLPSVRKKIQRIETISATSKEANNSVVHPTPLKATSSLEVLTMAANPLKLSRPTKEKTADKHISIGKIKKLHPTNVNVCRSHKHEKTEMPEKKAPVPPRSANIPSTDFIKSNINREFTTEQKEPTKHKNMCEKITKEISINKASKSERVKGVQLPAKNEGLIRRTKETKSKKELAKNDKKILNKESSKALKNKDRVKKSKFSSLDIEKSDNKEKNLDKEHKKQQNSKPTMYLTDFDGLNQHSIDKETERQHKTQSHSPKRQKLKRVRTNSDDTSRTMSDFYTHSSIRSEVQVTENCGTNPPKRHRHDESFDLRSKTSKANKSIYIKKLMQNDTPSEDKKTKKRENLKITVETHNDKKTKSPKKTVILKNKQNNKCHQLKLIINIVCQGSDDATTLSNSSYSETENTTHNVDLSFLDDFNVDEIVDCLEKTEKNTKISSSESYKFRNPASSNCKIEETLKNNGLGRSNTPKNPSPTPDVKKLRVNKEEMANIEHKYNKSTTISQKIYVDEVTAILSKNEDIVLDLTNDIEYDQITSNVAVEVTASMDNTENIILDLTNDIKDEEIKLNQDVPEVMATFVKNEEFIIVDLTNDIQDTEIKLNLDVTEVTAILDKNEEIDIVDLTNDIKDSEIQPYLSTNKSNFSEDSVVMKNGIAVSCLPRNPSKDVVEEKDANNQLETASDIFIEQEIHFISLPNIYIDNISEENGKGVEDKTEFMNDAQVINKTQIELIEEKTQPIHGYGNSDTIKEIHFKHKVEEPFETVKVRKLPHTKAKENLKNVSETNMGQGDTVKKDNAPINTKNMSKLHKSESEKQDTKNIVEYVWDAYVCDIKIEPEKTKATKNEPGSTFNTNTFKNEFVNTFKASNSAKNESGNTFKTSNAENTKPVTEITRNAAQTQPENTFKTSSTTKNESGNTLQTKNAAKSEPDNTLNTLNKTIKNEPDNTLKTSKAVKNKPGTTFKTSNADKSKPITEKTRNATQNQPENTFKTSSTSRNESGNKLQTKNAAKSESDNTLNTLNKPTKNEPGSTFKTSNADTSKPVTEKTRNAAQTQPENTFKTSSTTKNESGNKLQIKNAAKSDPDNSLNTLNKTIKNGPDNTLKTSKAVKNEPGSTFKTSNADKSKPVTEKNAAQTLHENTLKTSSATKNESGNTFKTSNADKSKPVTEKTRNAGQTQHENTLKTSSDTKNESGNTLKTSSATRNESRNKLKTKNAAESGPDNTLYSLNKTTKNELDNTLKTSKAVKNEPGSTLKTSNAAKSEPGNTFKFCNATKNEPGNTLKTSNADKNKPVTENISNAAQTQHENTFKTRTAAKNEPENTFEIINSTKNEPGNTFKTNKSAKNEPENTLNKITKNEPDNTFKTCSAANFFTRNTFKIGATKNEPENSFKTNNAAKKEPENTLYILNKTTKNYSGNTLKTDNASKNEPGKTSNSGNDTKNKPGTSKTKFIIGKKVQNEIKHKELAVLLEHMMLECLRKEIKIINHIHLGKYSNIFRCKDATGQTYAVKILTDSRNANFIKQRNMIRQLQQDVPKDKLNTVYLVNGFREQKCCFLTEYYPKNLQQVLKEQVNMKPFHINRVQELARQLISAVMVLRNNFIVHSDIQPTHILLDATQNRLKLCGFDEAYYMEKYVYPLPSIGTADYRAPEIILGFSAGYSIDVWSSALVIHEMATNAKLFSGTYNNGILYKQITTFGNLPQDMIDASLYKMRYFREGAFIREEGNEYTLMHILKATNELQMTLTNAYNKHWATSDKCQRDSDMSKLTVLNNLLERMLVLDPRCRLAIKDVSTDPFIYETSA